MVAVRRSGSYDAIPLSRLTDEATTAANAAAVRLATRRGLMSRRRRALRRGRRRRPSGAVAGYGSPCGAPSAGDCGEVSGSWKSVGCLRSCVPWSMNASSAAGSQSVSGGARGPAYASVAWGPKTMSVSGVNSSTCGQGWPFPSANGGCPGKY